MLHHDEGAAGLFADVINRTDIRVIQRRGSFGFAAEAFEGMRIVGKIVRKEFEGDRTVEACVLGFINHTHSAAYLRNDAGVGNGVPDE